LAQQTFGNRLAEARRRRGLTLEQVHLQLRISPTILEALEVGDFRHMPLKGHARNMVSSYARYLGLDPEDVTKQFLSEYHEFENRESRTSSAPFSSSISANVSKADHAEVTPFPSQRGMPQRTGKYAEGQRAKSMWDKPIPKSELNRGYDSRSLSAQRLAKDASRRRSPSRGQTRSQAYDDRLVGRSGSGSYTAHPSFPARVFGALFRSPVALVIVLIIVLVALLTVWAIVANSCRKQENQIIPVNTGSVVTEDTPPTDMSLLPETPPDDEDDSEYGPFELVVEPVEGTGPWTEVTVDGENVCAEILTERKSWEVTADCEIKTGQPDNLRVSRNGEEVTLTISAGGLGSAELEVQTKPDNQDQANQEAGTNG
jgi:cytoskeletal protein RodZ